MIIGENETKSGIYKIKDMKKKEEYSLNKEELINLLKG
jgi:histidyl-tRNA synthetase